MSSPTRPGAPSAVLRRARGWARHGRLAALGVVGDRVPRLYERDTLAERRHLFDQLGDPAGNPLDEHEASRFSQNGEDGVIAELLRRVGAPTRTFVEIGSSDGGENCTRALAEVGWSGVWIEGDGERAALASARALPGVQVVNAFVERGNVAELLRGAAVGAEPDVLVVDIDGEDLAVLDAALVQHRPRLVVVEYNAAFVPPAVWSLPRRLAGGWDGTFRFGASLQAFVDTLAGRYLLVHCDRSGVNAFFVRADLLDAGTEVLGTSRLFRRAAYARHPFGHVRSRAALAPMSELVPDPGTLRIEAARPTSGPVAPGAPVAVDVVVDNRSDRRLSSGRPHALNLVLRWIDRDDEPPPTDAARTTLAHPVPAGRRRRTLLWIPAPSEPGRRTLRVTAVLEGVAWLEHLGGPDAVADVVVEVRPTQGSSTLP